MSNQMSEVRAARSARRELTDPTLSQFGALGGRDHSTVLHGCDTVQSLMADPGFSVCVKGGGTALSDEWRPVP